MSTTTIRPRTPFLLWLHEQCLRTGSTLFREVSAEFPTAAINQMFAYQLRQAVERLSHDALSSGQEGNERVAALRNSIEQTSQFNWCGYISRSLRSAGVRDQDLDAATSEVVVKLLHQPGGLFRRWDGVSPIIARFKTSVKNASINAGKKTSRQTRRHVLSFSEPGVEAAAPPQQSKDTVANFHAWIELRLGKQAVAVLDHIIDGGDVKDLVGVDGMTSYRIKRTVRDLKKELLAFGKGDPDLFRSVKKALDNEAKVLKKRFGDRYAPDA